MSTDNPMTVRGKFIELVSQYEEQILKGVSSIEQDAAARSLIPQFELLWDQLFVLGVFSSNDELDDFSTSSLELLWVPYILADLYQRVQGQLPTPGATVPLSAVAAQELASATSMKREETLVRSHRWFDVFFQWALNCELVDERTLETYCTLREDQRTQRVELSRKRRELEQEMRRCEERVQYLLAKRKRMQKLLEDDGDEMEDENGEEEEALRNRALARLRWSVYESFHQLHLSKRELEMLQALSPDMRKKISEEHQKTIEAVQRGEKSLGRHTYTILPGGLITPGGPISTANLSSSATSAVSKQQALRQKVVDELMIERNKPTMTLQEFAEAEIADMQQRMDASAAAKRQQDEEDERLGPDGVEERQRQRDTRLADWKDDHAPIGQTARGNYA